MSKQPNSKFASIAVIVLLVVALVGAVMLSRQNQNTQRGAYFAGAKLLLLPADNVTAKVGDDVPVQLWVQTDANAKVSSVDTKICYGNGLKLMFPTGSNLNSLITINPDAFGSIEMSQDKDNCLRLAVISSGIATADLKSGLVKVAAIRFKAIKAGKGSMVIDQKSSLVGGDNSAPGSTDTAMKIGSVTSTSYTIGGSPVAVEESLGQKIVDFFKRIFNL